MKKPTLREEVAQLREENERLCSILHDKARKVGKRTWNTIRRIERKNGYDYACNYGDLLVYAKQLSRELVVAYQLVSTGVYNGELKGQIGRMSKTNSALRLQVCEQAEKIERLQTGTEVVVPVAQYVKDQKRLQFLLDYISQHGSEGFLELYKRVPWTIYYHNGDDSSCGFDRRTVDRMIKASVKVEEVGHKIYRITAKKRIAKRRKR